MRDERQSHLESRQEQLESKMQLLMEHYRRSADKARERQAAGEEIAERIAELESEQVERPKKNWLILLPAIIYNISTVSSLQSYY